MAVPSGTYQTFQQIGIREDLSDEIFLISPTETPFLTGIAKTKATNPFHEWQTDTLAAAAANAAIDVDDASTNTAVPTVRLRNYVQYMTKVPQVSEGAQAVNTAGRADEMDYQVMKRGKELKLDLEFALSRNAASTAGGAASAPTSAGVESWLSSNRTSVQLGTTASTPGYSGTTVAAPTDSSTAGTLTEAALRAVITACYNAGGMPDTLLTGPSTKNKITDAFTGVATRFRDVPSGSKAQIISGVDLYVSNFGDFKLVPSRIVRDVNILVLDMRMWKCAFLIPFTSWELAKTGASMRRQLYVAATLEASNQASSGKVTDINPAL